VTATLVAFKSGASPQPPDPSTEAKHLLRVIEKQPGCLMRVGLDGLLLAVNEAAMKLLGASELSQVVGTRLTKLVLARHHEQWDELTARIREGAAASLECELTDLGGVRRTILMQAVPLLDHPDGTPSMIAVARDSSVPRRLEAALREREVSEELGDLQKQLTTGTTKTDAPVRAEAPVVPHEILARHAAELARVRQTLADEHQLALLLKDQEAGRAAEKHQKELAETAAERQRLSTLLEERRAEVERAAATHRTELSALQQTLAEEHQLALLLKDQETRRLHEQHRGELLLRDQEARRLQEVHRTELILKDQETERLEEQYRRELVLKDQQAEQLREHHRIELEQAAAESQRLVSLIEEREAYYQGLVREHAAALSEAERGSASALTKQAELEKALADQRVKSEMLDENARNLEWLAGIGRAGSEIGRELQTIMAEIDARAEFLLAQSRLDAEYRHVVEALRGDAITAASLSRQIVQPNTVTELVRENASGDAGRKP
jgi:hypothetical protein